MRMKTIGAALMLAAGASGTGARPPIIDMHLHVRQAAYSGEKPPPMCTPFKVMPRWDPSEEKDGGFAFNEPPCAKPIPAAGSDEEVMRETLAAMERRNIIGMVSGEPALLAPWIKAAPDRIIPGLEFRLGVDSGHRHVTPRTAAEVRALYEKGAFKVLGEIMAQYEGLRPDDPRLEPIWALAEELGIPAGIHLGPGGPADPYGADPAYRARNGSPLGLEEVLVRHPKLRIYIMHAGYPFIDDLRALLFTHPQVYLDVSGIVYTEPRPAFYAFLKSIVDAGYGDRIMFGSDQMIWPGIIEPAIQAIEEAPFLSEKQKRDIFYNNAARFLRLSDAEIARHHAM